jgi:NAD-dependent DNA ligase
MGSQNKITHHTEVDVRVARWVEANAADRYCVSSKLDGVSCLLTVDEAQNVRCFTRGDGRTGRDITCLVVGHVQGLPVELPSPLAVRGELVVEREWFRTAGTKFANERSMVIGLLAKRKHHRKENTLLSRVHFVAYEVVGQGRMAPLSQQFAMLAEWGFLTADHKCVERVHPSELHKGFAQARTEGRFPVDGLVVQADVEYTRNTQGNPAYAFAFKVRTEVAEARVRAVEWNVTKDGVLAPTVLVDTVILGGTRVSRVTGKNARYVESQGIGPGAVLCLTRAGEVIPKIVSVVQPASTPGMPASYRWDARRVHALQNTPEGDDDQAAARLRSFFTKVGASFVGKSAAARLVDECGVREPLAVLQRGQECLSKRAYASLRSALTGVALHVLLDAAGVFEGRRLVGKERIRVALEAWPSMLEEAPNLAPDDVLARLCAVRGLSRDTAGVLQAGLPRALAFLRALPAWVTVSDVGVPATGSMSGQVVAFTGFRDPELAQEVRKQGGRMVDGVTRATTVLVRHGTHESSKVRRARQLGIEVVDRDKFII